MRFLPCLLAHHFFLVSIEFYILSFQTKVIVKLPPFKLVNRNSYIV